MTTRQDVVDAALRRYEAMQRRQETESALLKAGAALTAARDAHMRAISDSNAANKEHAAIEAQLIEQTAATGEGET